MDYILKQTKCKSCYGKDIDQTSQNTSTQIKLRNELGKGTLSKNNLSEKAEIDVSTLKSGIYFIEIINKNYYETKM